MAINEIISLTIIGLSVISCLVLLFMNDEKLKIIGVMLIVGLSIFSFDFWLIFAALFIVATLVTELTFLQNLAAIIRGGNEGYFNYMKATKGETEYESDEIQDGEESLLDDKMIRKILNTLWTFQVKKYPDLSNLFTFRIEPGSVEYDTFQKAASKLLDRRIVMLTQNGQYALTDKGLKFLKENHGQLGDARYFEEEDSKEENLPKIFSTIESKFE